MAALGHTVDSGSGASGNYASLSALEAAQQQDLTDGGGDTYTATCITTGDNAADTTATAWNGWITATANYVEIKGGAGNRASAAGYGETKYRLEVTDNHALTIQDDHVRVDGLQIRNIYSAQAGRSCIIMNSLVADNDIRISNCYLKGDPNVASGGNGVNNEDDDAILKIWNTIMFEHDGRGIIAFGTTVDVYNTVIYGSQIDGIFFRGTSNWTITNCAVFNNVDDFDDGTSGTIAVDHTASDNGFSGETNAVAESGGGAAWPDDFTDAAGGDFTLVSGSGLIGTADVDPGSGLFSDDIDGTTRGVAWDVGAFEFVAAGGGVNVVPLLRHRRQMAMR